jgi:general stress protein 26
MLESDKEKVLAALRRNRIASMATVTADGQPQAVTILYVVDDDLNLYFVTREKSRKVANLDANGMVAMSIGLEPPMNVQLEGRAVRVDDELVRADKMAELAHAGADLEDLWPPILRVGKEGYVLYKVMPEKVRALDLSDHNISSEDPPYIELM